MCTYTENVQLTAYIFDKSKIDLFWYKIQLNCPISFPHKTRVYCKLITYIKIIYTHGSTTHRFPSFEYKVEDAAAGFGGHLLPLFLFSKCHNVARRKRLRQTDSAPCYHVDFRYLVIAQCQFWIQHFVQITYKKHHILWLLITKFAENNNIQDAFYVIGNQLQINRVTLKFKRCLSK